MHMNIAVVINLADLKKHLIIMCSFVDYTVRTSSADLLPPLHPGNKGYIVLLNSGGTFYKYSFLFTL